MRRLRARFLLAAATSLAAHNNNTLAATQPCRSMEYERNAYTICEIEPREHTVRLYWKRSDGTPYAYLSAPPRALESEVGRLLSFRAAPARRSKRAMVWAYARKVVFAISQGEVSFDAFARLFRGGPNQPSPSRPTECAYPGRAARMRRHGQPAGDVASKFLRRYVLFLFDAMV